MHYLSYRAAHRPMAAKVKIKGNTHWNHACNTHKISASSSLGWERTSGIQQISEHHQKPSSISVNMVGNQKAKEKTAFYQSPLSGFCCQNLIFANLWQMHQHSSPRYEVAPLCSSHINLCWGQLQHFSYTRWEVLGSHDEVSGRQRFIKKGA